MKIIEWNGDLPMAFANGIIDGDECVNNDELSANLRDIDNTIIDATLLTTFFVDDDGKKHIVNYQSWQQLNCDFFDVLTNSAGIWRVSTEIDQLRKSMQLSAAQARIKLSRMGLLLDVLKIMNTLPDDSEAKILWEYETVLRRLNPILIEFLFLNFKMNDEKIDALFM